MYKLQISTELMKNQKAAQALSVQSRFDALQTADGRALFFSVGDDNLFYLSAEQEGAQTGWSPVNLTADLGASFPGQTVTAKTFAASQDSQSGNILIAQAAHVAEENADHLYLLTGLPDATGAAWLSSASARPWLARPYDDETRPLAALDIAYVNVTPHQNQTRAPYVVVGLRDPQTSFIQNYLVNTDPAVTSGVWKQHQTAENYDQLLGMSVGRLGNLFSSGLYELYTLGGETALTFTPFVGLFNAPPVPTSLTPPAGASSIATLPVDPAGHTNLYVAGAGAIYLFTPADQSGSAAGAQIVANDLINGVKDLQAHVFGGQVVLWGHNNQGQVFYTRCPLAAQGDPASWSCPVPIEQGVVQMASVLNRQTQANELYVHTGRQQVVRLTQDPATTEWRSQGILLPSLNPDDVIEFYTYTTHVSVTDENNLPLPNTAFNLTTTAGARTVYLNNSYVTLSTDAPVEAQSDATGVVTLVQETATLGASCYNLVQGDGTTVNVNPMSAVLTKMKGVQSGTDLSNIKVKDEQGQSSPLVNTCATPQQSGCVTPAQCDATASGIGQFVQISSTLPQDGSVKHTAAALAACRRTFDPATDQVWGMSFAGGDVRYFEGLDQMRALGLGPDAGPTASGEPGGILSGIEALAGDLFRWLKDAFEDAEHFYFQVIDDVTHFFIRIAGVLYHAAINCITDVVHGVEFVFKKIAVAFEKLVQWVGFIFNWGDILRTHQVLKNIFQQYVAYAIAQLPHYKTALAGEFDILEAKIAEWGGLPDIADSISSRASQSSPRPGQNSPQAHYGVYHAKHNAAAASINYSTVVGGGGQADQLLGGFAKLYGELIGDLDKGFDMIKAIATPDNLKGHSAKEIVSELIGVFGELFLKAVKQLTLAAIDVIAALAEGAAGAFDAPIDIPVLSWLYKKISGDQLTLLDLACLIVAIPTTIVYKLAEEKQAPFPADDPFTQQVINAPNFETIQQLYASGAPQTMAPGAALSSDSDTRAAVLSSIFDGSAFFSSLLLIVVGAGRSDAPDDKGLAILYGVLYLPYVSPNITVTRAGQTWDVIMSEAITGVSVAKTVADVAVICAKQPGAEKSAWEKTYSPIGEACINALWEIPTVGAVVRKHDANGIVGFLGNTSFNFGGVLTPFAESPNVQIAIGVCTALYGLCEFVLGVD